jgi:hypothetical protein
LLECSLDAACSQTSAQEQEDTMSKSVSLLAFGLMAALFSLAPEHAQAQGGLLDQRQVTGVVGDVAVDAVVTIERLDLGNVGLLATGVVDTVVNGTHVVQTFERVPASLIDGSTGASCDIQYLDLGPIHLDLLGLTLDLSELELDLNGQTGNGKLLGNLLCSVTGLLDGGIVGGLLRGVLLGLLGTINGLL